MSWHDVDGHRIWYERKGSGYPIVFCITGKPIIGSGNTRSTIRAHATVEMPLVGPIG